MQKFIYIIMIILLASGCQTILSSNNGSISPTADISIIKRSNSHLIGVEIEDKLKSMLNDINFYNITDKGDRYVLIAGSIRKPIGVSIDRKKIKVSLLNSEGSVLAAGFDKVSVVRLRRPVGSRGRFSIKVPYSADIKRCVISIEPK